MPTFVELLIPTLKAWKFSGGSGAIEEINEKVFEIMRLDAKTLEVPRKEGGLRSEVDYRMAWARTYLKKFGLIDNSSRGVWSLVDQADPDEYERNEIVGAVRKGRCGTSNGGSFSDGWFGCGP